LKYAWVFFQTTLTTEETDYIDTILRSRPYIAFTRHPRASWLVGRLAALKMSGEKIKSLVELANNRLNSSEDFELFQSFVTRELDLDTVSTYSSSYYFYFFHNPSSILSFYIYTICQVDGMLCKITQLVIKDYNIHVTWKYTFIELL